LFCSVFKQDCVKNLSVVGVLPAVGSSQNTLSLEKHGERRYS